MYRLVRVTALLSVVALGACGQLLGAIPAVDEQVIVPRVAACNSAADTPKAANDYMQVGFANVYAACEAFFVSATKFQQNALATNQTLDAGLVGATSIINSTMAAASAVKAITITTVGIVFGKAILNDYVQIYTFGTHLYKVRQLVQADMDGATRVPAPADTCVAYANVQKMALKCTIANMQALLDAQVAIPSQVATAQTPTTQSAPATAQMMRAPRAMSVVPPPQYSVPMSTTVIAR